MVRSTPTVLGLLGGIGAGKSHVAGRLADRVGARVVDADRMVGAALVEAAAAGGLDEALGDGFVHEDGSPDREAVAKRVFADPAALAALEALLHPVVLERIEAQVGLHRSGDGPALLVLDVPLLLERGLDRLCDALWFVDAPESLRFERAADRGLSPAEIERRERRQAPLARKRERADFVIHNDREIETQITEGLSRLGITPPHPAPARRPPPPA